MIKEIIEWGKRGVKRKRSLLLEGLLIVSMMVLLPSLLSTLYFYQTVPQRMQRQAEANAAFYIGQMRVAVEESMEMTRDMAFNTLTANELKDRMQNLSMALSDSEGQSALQACVGSTVTYRSAWQSHIFHSLYLFRNDGQSLAYSTLGTYAGERREMKAVYENTYMLSSARTLYTADTDAINRLYFIMDYKNIDTLQQLGKVIVTLSADNLIDTAQLNEIYPGSIVRLSNDHGDTLLSFNRENAEQEPEENADEYYQVSDKIGSYDLQLDVFIPLYAIYGAAQETSRLYLSFCVLILMLMLIIGTAAYQGLLRPLRNMEETLSKMASSDYTVRMPPSKFRELTQLQESFNDMADHLEVSFRDAYQKGIALQESESRLLAAQINPHFIFNVLETINMRCVEAGHKDISRMVTDLAQLLRGNIGSGSQQKVTIAQELNYVHYYLELQKRRFGDLLSCSVEYEDDELLNFYLPRLTIQPIVENAIVHGLEPKKGLGHVSIRLWEEETIVCIRVQDDGVGFDPGALDVTAEDIDTSHNHIALPNILRRLHLFYGERASLRLRSQKDAGTTVLLVIPIDRKEE